MGPRLSRTETSALLAFASSVRAEFGERVRDVRLFGSRARGEGHEDSDLDVLVLLSAMTRSERRSVQDAAYDAGETHHLIVSPLVADADAWRRDLPIAQAILRDGVPL
jgi:predicted nucleotidyltransferase